MTRTVKVSEYKQVDFPAGYLRNYKGNDIKHISWVREYSMTVHRGRGGVMFSTIGDYDFTYPFSRAALKRLFDRALKFGPDDATHDERTNIKIRRVGKSLAFELDMPCGETACIKQSVLARLVKELENV